MTPANGQFLLLRVTSARFGADVSIFPVFHLDRHVIKAMCCELKV